MQLLDVNPN